jgi:DNA-binding transcriptional LysR family regulator
MAGMEIHHLRTFLAVARTGNLTRAGDQLHLTQPAVSKQLKALEDELGVLLFDRLPSGMALTKTGQLLLPQAEKALFGAMELLNQAKSFRSEIGGKVRLGTIIDPESTQLGSFLSALLERYPLVQVKLLHGISGSVMDKLTAGDVDAGFYLGRVQQSGVLSLHLKTVTYRMVAPTAWAARLQDATWDTIRRMPWVGTPAQSSQYRLVREMLAEHGYEPHVVVEADQESSMISLVRNGVGLCLMRDSLADAAALRGEVLVWPGAAPSCPLSFIYRDAHAQDPLTVAMLEVLREIWDL